MHLDASAGANRTVRAGRILRPRNHGSVVVASATPGQNPTTPRTGIFNSYTRCGGGFETRRSALRSRAPQPTPTLVTQGARGPSSMEPTDAEEGLSSPGTATTWCSVTRAASTAQPTTAGAS